MKLECIKSIGRVEQHGGADQRHWVEERLRFEVGFQVSYSESGDPN